MRGQVRTQLTIVNRADEVRAADGTISPDQIRKVTVDNVMAGSGATHLCLPIHLIVQKRELRKLPMEVGDTY